MEGRPSACRAQNPPRMAPRRGFAPPLHNEPLIGGPPTVPPLSQTFTVRMAPSASDRVAYDCGINRPRSADAVGGGLEP
jgi:hypothetical protein